MRPEDKIESGMWRSEYERPIYFVETREGYTCSLVHDEGRPYHFAAASAVAGGGPGCCDTPRKRK